MHLTHQRATQAHRIVQARQLQTTGHIGVDEVIQDVDATAKRQELIDDTQLAVQTPPAAGQPKAKSRQGRVHAALHTGLVKTLRPLRGQSARSHTIHHHAHAHTALGSTDQRMTHISACACKVKNVGF